MAGPLDGIRVIDVSAMASGPLATMILGDQGADVIKVEPPCAPVVTRDELVTHPQIVANELLVESTHPHAGRMRQPRPAARFGATPSGIRRPAPLHGEHTDEVLQEIGCSPPEIAELRAAHIVG